MDLTHQEIKFYIGTLAGILKMIDEMPSPTVKKIRYLLKEEFDKMLKTVSTKH